jgi:hypothetical protein
MWCRCAADAALADDRDDVRHMIAFNLVFAVLMILVFVTETEYGLT